MSYLKKFIKVLANILTCILLFVFALVLYGKIVITFTDNSYPNYFGYTFFEVASGSMEPTLSINDIILVKVSNRKLKKGDIIAFYSDKTVITHRIMFIDGNVITVKGDNNNVVDKPILKEQVIGKMVKVFPRLGIWRKVITEPKILIVLFVTLLLFDYALSYGDKESKKKNNEDLDSLVKEVPLKEEKIQKKSIKKDVIESDELLELTRKIDIDEINKLLEGTDYTLEKKEINNIKKEIVKIEEKKKEDDVVVPKLSSNEKKALEYTMRLDLNEIQKKIGRKIK